LISGFGGLKRFWKISKKTATTHTQSKNNSCVLRKCVITPFKYVRNLLI
jgi:hypothetical protein